MPDIWGDGNNLAPHTLVSGADGVSAALPPMTIVGDSPGLEGTVPPHTISASGSFLDFMVGTLPIYTLETDYIPGDLIVMSVDLPPHTSEGEVFSGAIYEALLDMPAHALIADFGWFANLDLPAYELDGLSVMGEVMVGTLVLPAYTLSAVGVDTNRLTAANDLPAYILSASSLTGGIGQAALLLPAHTLDAVGYSGAVLTGDNDLPVYVLVGLASTPYTADAALTLPMYQLDAAMTQAITQAFQAWALNLRNRAVTSYTNFNFNSFTVFEGRLFGATATGVYELAAQADDAGIKIAASLRTGKHHFGTTYAKRIPRAYLGYWADGDMEVQTITGEGGTRAYLLPWNGTEEVQQRRLPIGRGPKTVYWQFGVANRDGADFGLDNLQLFPEASKRRVA